MSDVRALLKAKRQEARIVHPLAVYSTSGQLRCIACTINVKHGSAWEGHLGSKVHRTNVTGLKDAERRGEEWKEEQRIQGKRKAEEYDGDSDETKRPKVQAETGKPSPFPADFFDDSSQVSLLPHLGDPGDEEEKKRSHLALASHETSVLDLEWERFQRDVLNQPDRLETYERATVFAEPVIVSNTQAEGLPSHQSDDTEPAQVDSKQVRRRKEQDERELIMDRLLDEERAQEEADLRVAVMKERLDALKERRQAVKAIKADSS